MFKIEECDLQSLYTCVDDIKRDKIPMDINDIKNRIFFDLMNKHRYGAIVDITLFNDTLKIYDSDPNDDFIGKLCAWLWNEKVYSDFALSSTITPTENNLYTFYTNIDPYAFHTSVRYLLIQSRKPSLRTDRCKHVIKANSHVRQICNWIEQLGFDWGTMKHDEFTYGLYWYKK